MSRRRFLTLAVPAGVALTCAALTVAGAAVTPAPQRTAAGWDVQVSQDTLNIPGQQADTEAEPAIAVNPNDPDNVVATFQTDLKLGAVALGFATSRDGGRTWRDGYLPGTRARQGHFDASADAGVTFGPDGTVYATGDLNDFGTGADVPSQIAIWTSHDGGLRWTDPVAVVTQQTQVNGAGAPYSIADASRAVVDQSRLPGHHYGRVYVTWDHFGGQVPGAGQVSAAYSDDRGRTWNLGPSGQGYTVDAQTGSSAATEPMVLPSGDFAVVVSADGLPGATAVSHQRIAIAPGAGAVATGQPLLFTEQYPIGVAVGDVGTGVVNSRQSFTASYAVSAVDQRSGVIYAVWGDSRFRSDVGICDIVLTSSADGGKTWTQPVRVNRGATDDNVDHYLPRVDVGPDGSVYVAYRQQQDGSSPDGSADSRSVDTYLQVSHDHGATFSAPVRVNARSTDLGFAVAKPVVTSPNGGMPWLADYEEMAAAPGRVYAVRAEALNLHLGGESPQLPPKWHHQRIFVATVLTSQR